MGDNEGYDWMASEREVLLHYLDKMRDAVVRVFLDEDRGTDDSMEVPADATREQVVAAYRKTCARSDEIVRACPDLSTMARVANPGEDQKDPLRVIVAHMVEETARHAGHADILREWIDGATGL
jgi:hypothetical protein